MSLLKSKNIDCPYCGEDIEIIIDCSIDSQDYIEDCSVCCRPINLTIIINTEGEPQITVRNENE